MFNNLIESSLHTREFKRRGSFLLLTSAVYALLFVSAGVASIYAYDVHLNNDEANQLVLLGFVPLEPQRAVAAQPHRTTSANTPRNSAVAKPATQPQHVVAAISPNSVPLTTGVTASPLPVAQPGVQQGPLEPNVGSFGAPGGGGDVAGSPGGTASPLVHDVEPPPSAPTPKPIARTVSKPVLNGYAIELPKPPYPEIAKRARAQGMVQVQVLIDENGKVVSARAVSGHPLLVNDAVRAAYRAVFSPTKLGDLPVKVSGVIYYNFTLD